MPTAFDTRPWNLLAGVALISAGCSGRTTSIDTDTDTDTNTDTSASGGPETSTGTATVGEDDPPECIEDSDCPPSYYCIEGICEYFTAPDGGPWFGCYTNAECGPLQLCVYNYCDTVASPPSCGEPVYEPPLPFELGIPEAILTMAFADADADGREELVLGSVDAIYAASPEGTTESYHQFALQGIDAMAAGELDGNPGDDVALVYDDTLWVIPADGLGGFAQAGESDSPIVGTRGLIAGDYNGMDGDGLDDLLVYGEGGASLAVLAGGATPMSMATIVAAAARELGQGAGFGLRTSGTVEFHALDGTPLTSSPVVESNTAGPMTSVHWADTWYDLSATPIVADTGITWTAFEQWSPGAGERVAVWGLEGETLAVSRADLDGDGHDELALIHADAIWILRDVGGPNECLEQLDYDHEGLKDPYTIAAGDYDGDGDDELAAAFEGYVYIRDGAG